MSRDEMQRDECGAVNAAASGAGTDAITGGTGCSAADAAAVSAPVEPEFGQGTGFEPTPVRLLTRRRLVRGAAGLAGIAVVAGLGTVVASLAGCTALQGNLRTVEDMGGREVAIPEEISRVFCSNPIGTVNIYLLNPDALVGWNFRPTGDNRKYIPEKYLNLPPLGVWMGAGATPNDEEIVRQSPQVILCYWTADDVGRSMADKVRDETGCPVLLVDYDIRKSAESFRFVGPLIGATKRAEELAAYCEQKIASIKDVVKQVPKKARKSVYIAQGVGGLSTDPVGSMHVTDALELIGTSNVADMPGTVGQGMGMPTVNLEQIITWNPDAVLVSEYSMSDSESSDLYGELSESDDWKQVPAVAAGRIYRLPQSPFAWFGRPPSVVRLLGCMLLLRLLYPEYAGDIDLAQETRDFYKLFYQMELDDRSLAEILQTVGAYL